MTRSHRKGRRLAGGKASGWEMFLIERNLRGVPSHGHGKLLKSGGKGGGGLGGRENLARVKHGVDTFQAVRQVDVPDRAVTGKIVFKAPPGTANFHLFCFNFSSVLLN